MERVGLMTKIEEVARALCKADGKNPDADCKISTCGGEVAMKEWQYHYPFMAQRAIEALRVPSDAMIAAGQQVAVDSAAYDAADEVEVFNAMIDAALAE